MHEVQGKSYHVEAAPGKWRRSEPHSQLRRRYCGELCDLVQVGDFPSRIRSYLGHAEDLNGDPVAVLCGQRICKSLELFHLYYGSRVQPSRVRGADRRRLCTGFRRRSLNRVNLHLAPADPYTVMELYNRLRGCRIVENNFALIGTRY